MAGVCLLRLGGETWTGELTSANAHNTAFCAGKLSIYKFIRQSSLLAFHLLSFLASRLATNETRFTRHGDDPYAKANAGFAVRGLRRVVQRHGSLGAMRPVKRSQTGRGLHQRDLCSMAWCAAIADVPTTWERCPPTDTAAALHGRFDGG